MLTFSSLGGLAFCVKDKGVNITVFPSTSKEGKEGELVLLSSPEEKPVKKQLSWPGEYDVEGISIRGIGQNEGQKVSFSLEINGVRCAFIASPLQEWADHELERLGDVDVLVLPAEQPKHAQKLVEQIDPRILILLLGGDKEEKEVCKACSAENIAPEKEYKLKSSLPQEGRETIVLH